MVVDEDPNSRVETRKALQRAELEVAGETGFGTRAVSLALDARPDAVLISVEEPAVRALETAEALADALPDTPVVIYSSESSAEAVRRGMVFGARDYVMKPVDAGGLRRAIIGALGQEERRQMRRAGQLLDHRGRGTIITVIGAKGGVGKTVVSVNLAVAMSESSGRSVVVIDADTHFGDVGTMLDLTPRMPLAEILRQSESLDRSGLSEYVTAHVSGVDVLGGSGSFDAWDDANAQQLTQVIERFAEVYDFVIVDTSGSFYRFVRAAVEVSTLTLIVTSPDVSSIRNTKLAIARLDGWGIDSERTRFILNHATRIQSVSREELRESLGREILLELPFDKAVTSSVQVGHPVVLRTPKSRAARELRVLAGRIAGSNGAFGTNNGAMPRWRALLQRKASV